MKKPYISSSQTGITVLRILKVRVSSGVVKTDVDTEAITFLQWAGFVSVKRGQQLDKHVFGESPEGEVTTLLLEHEVPPHLNYGPFRLIRIMQGNRTELDRGYTIFVDKLPDSVGEVSVVGVGEIIKDWEITCCVASADVLELNESLVARTATMFLGKTRRNRGQFLLDNKPTNQSVKVPDIAPPQQPSVSPAVPPSEESHKVQPNGCDGSAKPPAVASHRRFIIPYHGSSSKTQ